MWPLWDGIMGRSEQLRASQIAGGRASFGTTQWSVVRAAGQPTGVESREALATLCARYWYPLYVYARRRGLAADHAADMTQGFFTRLLEQKTIRGADPQRGKFRSYLLGTFKHFQSHEWQRARAQKRGGGRTLIPLDPHDAETRYNLEPSHELTPERLYERQWALTVLELSLEELGRQCAGEGKERMFLRFKPFLSGGTGEAYREAGAELGMNEVAVRVVVHRLRRRYRQLLRDQIRRTVNSADDVEDEIQHLFAAISS